MLVKGLLKSKSPQMDFRGILFLRIAAYASSYGMRVWQDDM